MLDDVFALTREDPDADDEPRFATLGLSDIGNLLVVVYTYREPDILRVISAWKANRRQRVAIAISTSPGLGGARWSIRSLARRRSRFA